MTIAARIANHIWKHSCCFDAVQWSRARGQLETTQAGHLLRLLRRQAQTRFGADHGFAEIRSVKDYRERVPIRNYDDYHVYLAAVFDGKTAVLTQDRVMRLEPTSGTSSGSKFIPYTWGLHRDFQAGLHPWIWNLYNRRIFGRITQHPPRLM